MKPVVASFLLTLLCACARQAPEAPAPAPASATGDATSASPATQAPPAKADAADMPSTDTPATGTPPAADASGASPAPAPTQGIAVGEPHPSGNVPVDAGPARYDGYGALRFGMSAEEARKAWKGGLQGDEVKPDNCAYLRPAGTAAGPYLMFEGGKFVRYDVRGANATAPGGGRVGMAADDIRRLYAGRVRESQHHYVPGGLYLRIADPASKARALLFEVDEHGRVTTWRVGRDPQVDYVEGCA